MKRVTILAMFNTMASTVIGPMDIFYQAGVIWNYFQGRKPRPFFETKIVTTDGRPLKCLNGTSLLPDGSIRAVESTDLIVVSSILNIDKTMKYQSEAVDWLKHHYRRGAHIATICTGAFVLAETGLLDGKTATTHWEDISGLQTMFPHISVKKEKRWIDEGRIITSAGISAGIDMSLHLVARLEDEILACKTARQMEFEWTRSAY